MNYAKEMIVFIDHIRRHIEAIQVAAEDPEEAHMQEDALWEDTLEAIANGAPNPAELAAEVLKTREVKFSRWYA